MRNLSGRIGDRFPTLNDGSQSLDIGASPSYMWRKVLRPDGNLDWVNYYTHVTERSVSAFHYLDIETLRQVERGVESVFFGWRALGQKAFEIVQEKGVRTDRNSTKSPP